MNKWVRLVFAIVFMAAFFALYERVSAATCSDPAGDGSVASIINNVSPNSGCHLGSNNNDSQTQVNTDAIFGLTDWVFLAKDEVDGGLGDADEGPDPLNFTIIGDALSGTWSVNSFGIYSNLMLVLKDGNGIPNVYVAYLLAGTSGTYATPFWNPSANNGRGGLKDISHFSLYGSLSPVPLPAALPLFGAALAGMGLLGWHRRRAAA